MSDKLNLIPLLGVGAASLVAGGAIGFLLGRSGCCQSKSLPGSTDPSSSMLDSDSRYSVSKTFHKDSVVDAYIMETSLREPEVLRKLRDATFQLTDDPGMICDPVEGQLIRMLLKMLGARKCLEVGTFTGYNALSMALALPHDGKVIACDISAQYVNVGRNFFKEAGVASKIDVHLRPALQTMDELIANGESGTFDFIFIDADKENYGEYYERALVLVRSGGIVGVDNTLWSGRVCMDVGEVRKIKDDFLRRTTLSIGALNTKIKSDKRVDVSQLKIGDGFTICRKI